MTSRLVFAAWLGGVVFGGWTVAAEPLALHAVVDIKRTGQDHTT